jgi:hypothetical protein
MRKKVNRRGGCWPAGLPKNRKADKPPKVRELYERRWTPPTSWVNTLGDRNLTSLYIVLFSAIFRSIRSHRGPPERRRWFRLWVQAKVQEAG